MLMGSMSPFVRHAMLHRGGPGETDEDAMKHDESRPNAAVVVTV